MLTYMSGKSLESEPIAQIAIKIPEIMGHFAWGLPMNCIVPFKSRTELAIMLIINRRCEKVSLPVYGCYHTKVQILTV